MTPPDDPRLRPVLDPAAQPGRDLRAALMVHEPGHRPGIDKRAGERRMQRRRGRGIGDARLHPLAGLERRDGARSGLHLVSPDRWQLAQDRSCCCPPRQFSRLVLAQPEAVLAEIEHRDLGLPVTAPVHAPEPLDHPFPRHKIAQHVVGIEIDADLASRRRHEKRGRLWPGAGNEASFMQLPCRLLALQTPSRANQQQSLSCLGALQLTCDLLMDLLSEVPALKVDENARRLRGPVCHGKGARGDILGLRLAAILDGEVLARVEPSRDQSRVSVFVVKRKDIASSSPSRRKRQDPKR